MIGMTFHNYHILEEIGGGNTGVVYLAYDIQHTREVALKILPDDFLTSQERKARFRRETRAANLLSHQAIAKLYATGEHEGHSYIAMEFVRGKSYKTIVNKHPEGTDLHHFFGLILPVIDGVAYAHHRNVAHRDLKPDNLMLNADGQAKILDFGLVKFLDGGIDSFETVAGMVLGSAGYMSPEQASGEELDYRTDIFSLGVIMYELLTGKNPFESHTPFATITRILNANPLSIELIRPEVPLELCKLVNRCLSKDMRSRFPNAGILSNELAAMRG